MIFKNLRKFTKTIMWVIAILIVPVFVIWNIGSSIRNRQSGYAGKIFDRRIPWKTYYEAKRAARNDAWLRYGDKLDQSINLEEQTWTRLILLEEAKRKKMKVTPQEILDYIKNLPTFQYAELTPKNYTLIITQIFQQQPSEFEHGIRGTIMMNKLLAEVTTDITLTNDVIKQEYTKENEQATASYVLIEPKDFLDQVTVENNEPLKKFYDEHQEQFKKPEQVNAEYIEIKLERFKNDIEISDDRIEKYYENNKEKYKINETENSATTAEEQKYKTLDEVKETIKEILIEKEMNNRAIELARQIMTQLYSNPDFAKVAESHTLSAETTGPFSMLQEIPKVGISFSFLKAAFSLNIGEISEVIKTPTAYYILKPIKKIKPHIPTFEEIVEEIKQAYIEDAAEELAKQKGQEILTNLKQLSSEENLSFNDAATKLGFAPKLAENFTRSGYVSGLGYAEEFSNAAFNLKPQEVSNLVSTPRGYCILNLEKIIPIDEQQFEQDKNNFKEKLLAQKRNNLLNEWFSQIKSEANPISYLEENAAK